MELEIEVQIMIKFAEDNKNLDEASDVQSVIFNKSGFTKSEAEDWLKSHKFSTATSRETDSTLRFRQQSPSKFDDFRIKKVTNNISFVLGF
jgi:O-methyltransferase involved in polyketide biosynthesis